MWRRARNHSIVQMNASRRAWTSSNRTSPETGIYTQMEVNSRKRRKLLDLLRSRVMPNQADAQGDACRGVVQ
jgi:hypothetical protein